MKAFVRMFVVGFSVLLFIPHARGGAVSECVSPKWAYGKTVLISAVHTVKRGDNLTRIAKQYGDTVSEIMKRNSISETRKHVLEIGARLFIRVRPTTAKVTWYGRRFHGRKMANSDVYDMHDPETVAHKKLPFGTKVLFRNPQNGKIIETEVRDRGPYVRGREFDLSKGAARALGIVEEGVSRLEYLITCVPLN